MKPSFALILSHDGIRLLRRAKGAWRSIGDALPEDPKLASQLKYLRRTATELSGVHFATKLVIPNEQILYRKIDALGATDERREQVIAETLERLTPYSVDELRFDWCDAGGGMAHVAAVANDTLAEAEAFAAEHRMNPVSFVAIPQADTFDREIWFGLAESAAAHIPEGETVGPDTDIISIISDVDPLDQPVVPGVEPDVAAADLVDEAAEKDADEADSETDGPIEPAFTTRREIAGHRDVTEPLNLKWVTPRMAMVSADQQASTPAQVPSAIPPAPAVNPEAEIAPVAVTAPDTGSDKIKPTPRAKPTASTAKAKTPPPVTRPVPMVDIKPQKIPPAPVVPLVLRQEEAEALTIFGARGQDPDAPPRKRIVGLALTLSLVAIFALAAIIVGLFLDAPINTARFWTGQDADGTLAPEPLTASPIVASGSFVEDESPAETPQPGVEVASLAPADMQSDLLAEPTPEEQAEAAGEAEPLTLEDIQLIYAETGLWLLAPSASHEPRTDRLDDVYIASIDRAVVSNDAVAMPTFSSLKPDAALAAMVPPPPFGTTYDLDERGFVRATPQGTATPEGAFVIAGRPSVVPPLRPGTIAPPETEPAVAEVEPEVQPEDPLRAQLAKIRPVLRPSNLLEQNERARFGGRTLAEIAQVRPTTRPASAQENDAATQTPDAEVTVLAASITPALRPKNFAGAVERALAEAAASATTEDTSGSGNTVVAAAVAPQTPSIPTKASVAREATVANAINLSKINLIGVYGSSSDRRALVRLKSGRYVKVQIGDRLDGGQVAAISATELRYVKSGRNLVLKLPTG